MTISIERIKETNETKETQEDVKPTEEDIPFDKSVLYQILQKPPVYRIDYDLRQLRKIIETFDCWKGVSLIKKFQPGDYAEIAKNAVLRELAPLKKVFRMNDPAESCFLVV